MLKLSTLKFILSDLHHRCVAEGVGIGKSPEILGVWDSSLENIQESKV